MLKVFNPRLKVVELEEIQPPMEYGFKDFNRNIWTNPEVDFYNLCTNEINRATYEPEREALLDRRHAHFNAIIYSRLEA